MGKILLIAVIVISVVTAGIGILNRSTIAETHDSLLQTQARVQGLQKELAEANTNLENAQKQLADATQGEENMRAQLNASKTEAENARNELSQAQQQIQDKESALEQAKADMVAKDTRIAELEAASVGGMAATTPEDDTNVEEMKVELAEQETLITKLQGDLSTARAQLEELRERERNRAAQVMRSGLEGKVLAVNQSWNFVVLSLGDRNGVVNNAEMLVKRGGQMIGKIRITSVEPSTSIADIVANSVPRGMSIQPGDNVIYVSSNN